ncbi:MAG: hypothetical protein IKG79_01830, partial [Neisseriaceae bacterium]|nr:hypothetical protein [Neisseriaceae bacterium]
MKINKICYNNRRILESVIKHTPLYLRYANKTMKNTKRFTDTITTVISPEAVAIELRPAGVW